MHRCLIPKRATGHPACFPWGASLPTFVVGSRASTGREVVRDIRRIGVCRPLSGLSLRPEGVDFDAWGHHEPQPAPPSWVVGICLPYAPFSPLLRPLWVGSHGAFRRNPFWDDGVVLPSSGEEDGKGELRRLFRQKAVGKPLRVAPTDGCTGFFSRIGGEPIPKDGLF